MTDGLIEIKDGKIPQKHSTDKGEICTHTDIMKWEKECPACNTPITRQEQEKTPLETELETDEKH